jgi:F-type H+-transporting ATPase subunit epsilon
MDNAGQIDLVVITPERHVLRETAEAVVIPAHDGELGVLRDRAPLLCELGIGQLRYSRSGQTRRLFIDGGFAQVLENHVTLLTSRAIPAEQVNAEVVAAAQRAIADYPGYDTESFLARQSAQQRLNALRRILAGE